MTKTLVLVVEDEPLIRMNAVALIEEAGYDVIEAAHADEAIELLETRPDIRVVFSDIEMPGGSMDGLKLIHAIRKRWPPVTLILASGRVSPRAEEMPSETVFLEKPYREDALLHALAAWPAANFRSKTAAW
ncbi:response regulator [Bosea sp. NBC_00550]|uniref:response regulator n=1 Tax=Bosea sp. NBC_00550 TaxID=2969621 RepID=UPI0022311C17|nr:response regulator [Bosea sp. NBC_00550]UZF94706.1 response regulator [Bosea sp. NBC_00550]